MFMQTFPLDGALVFPNPDHPADECPLLGGEPDFTSASPIRRDCEDAMGRASARILHPSTLSEPMESNPMQKLNDLSRSLTPLKPDGTLIAVIEMSLSSWLVAGIVPGIERQPLKKLEVDEGERKRRSQDTGSNASRSPSRPAVTASGWRVGSGRATSRPTSSTHRA